MIINEICSCIEQYAPPVLQESYDNSGLLIGSPDTEIDKALITLDVTEAVIDEAIDNKCGLIIAHHPLIFKGLKRLTGSSLTEQLVVKAIKADIAIYAVHTNLDNVINGVNGKLAEKLGLINSKVLSVREGGLKKLVVFCPPEYAEKVRDALFTAGAGHIGNYDSCSYNVSGKGSFRGLEGADPFVGAKGKLHFEEEIRIETIVPNFKIGVVLKAMTNAHPYEEVAYDIYPLDNSNQNIGAGMIGELENEQDPASFLAYVKKTLHSKVIKHSPLIGKKIKKVAICGGSGSFLINDAYRAGADIFITGDIKYHDFFEYNGQMTIADAGHYETEQFTKELLHSILKEKFPNFALLNSGIHTDPVSVL